MLNITNNTKPFCRLFNASKPTTSAVFHHQYRKVQLGTKSQSRSQSTLNPPMDSALPETIFNETRFKPSKPCNDNITTSVNTSLSDSLIPNYLEETYWWAYTHPNAVRFWERQWLVDTILWGNFNLLKNEAIDELHTVKRSASQTHFNVTQIACVYGNFSIDLVSAIGRMDGLDACNYKIIDIAPIQLINTKNKIDRSLSEYTLKTDTEISIDLYQNDSMNMESVQSNSEDVSYLFFLLHEQPKEVRLRTIEETIRITKQKGKIVIVDYHKPISNINPFRYIMHPILTYLEPFAIDLWHEQVTDYIEDLNTKYGWNITMEKKLYFNGLYQKIVLTKHT